MIYEVEVFVTVRADSPEDAHDLVMTMGPYAFVDEEALIGVEVGEIIPRRYHEV